MNLDALGKSGGFDKHAQPQIAGSLVPPSETKAANGESDTVSLLSTSAQCPLYKLYPSYALYMPLSYSAQAAVYSL